jgi:hypothetical protein
VEFVLLSGCRLRGLCELSLGSVVLRIKGLSIDSDFPCDVGFLKVVPGSYYGWGGVEDGDCGSNKKRKVFHSNNNSGWEIKFDGFSYRVV